MVQKYNKKMLGIDVYTATQQRLAYILDNFDNVLVSFSGGKDSGLCLNLCYEYAKRTNQLSKLAFYHLDYEAQYQHTTDYVTYCFNDAFLDISRKYWLCVPVTAPCSVSMYDCMWSPWDCDKKDIWVRKYPKSKHLVTTDNLEFPFKNGIMDYAFQDEFGEWFASKYGSTAVIVGIRTDESMNRFRAIANHEKLHNFGLDKPYLVGDQQLCLAYPIYDWTVQDVFTAYGKFGWKYNKLYDLMYMANVPIGSMRVASPFNNYAKASLSLYKAIEPNTWAKLVGRVNGVNFTGIYGKTTAMGWKSIHLPDGYTWKSYLEFLLSTLPEETRKQYDRKFKVSEDFWLNKGGVLSQATIDEIRNLGIKITVKNTTNYHSKNKPVAFEEYPDDLNVSDFKNVPSYKRMCICIMKNDIMCTYMGFSINKAYRDRQTKILEMYDNYVKGN